MFIEKDKKLSDLLFKACYVSDFSRAVNIASLFLSCQDIDGEVVEFGCYKGDVSILLSNLTNKKIYVYDSFEGLPEKRIEFDGNEFKKGQLCISQEELENNFKQNNTRLPIIKKGWFKDIKKNELPEKIAFAYLDGDFYESIFDSLNLVYNRMSPCACCIIDDYGWDKLPGVKKACDEFFYDKKEKVEVMKGMFGVDQGVFWKNKNDIAIVATWDNIFEKVIHTAWKNNLQYIKKYDYVCYAGKYEVKDRLPTWWRWKKAIEVLPKHDWIVLLDADLMIMNHQIKFEDFIDDNYDLIISQDVNGFNAGVIFIKNTEWSLQFINRLWTQGYSCFSSHSSPDQTALASLLYNEPKNKWKVLSQKLVNCYLYENYPWLPYYEQGQYNKGDFILHLASIPNEKRIHIFSTLEKEIIR